MDDQPHKRRQHPRVQANFRVSYPTVDKLLFAYAQDLSRGGMFLRTHNLLPLNAVVRVKLELPEKAGEISCIARIVYVRSPEEAKRNGRPPGMGVEFLDLAGENAERVERLIAEYTTAEAERAEAEQALKILNLLVVDDDRLFLETVGGALEAGGHRVRTCPDGLLGLAACLKEPPHVVLSDINMPKMDGWQLLRTIRARPSLSSVGVIFMSTLSGEDDRLRGYQLGVDDYIAKPCSPEELLERTEQVIARIEHSRQANVERKTLRGDLAQVSLPSLLSFLELERKTGLLILVGERPARIFLADGRPLRIELEDGSPEDDQTELAFRILGWTTGQFEFAAQDISCQDEIRSSSSSLVLEHARRRDESKRNGEE